MARRRSKKKSNKFLKSVILLIIFAVMVSVKLSIYIQKSAFFTDFLRSKSSADCLSFIQLKTNNIQKAEG